jgi:hypothetical protein
VLRIILVLLVGGLAWAAYRSGGSSTPAVLKTVETDRSPAANAIAAKRWSESDRQEQIDAIKIEKWSWKKRASIT